MEYEIKRTNDEIDELLNLCDETANSDDVSYAEAARAEAVKDAILWLTCEGYDNPME